MVFSMIDGTDLPAIFESKLDPATNKQYLEVKALNITDVKKYYLRGVIKKNGCEEILDTRRKPGISIALDTIDNSEQQ